MFSKLFLTGLSWLLNFILFYCHFFNVYLFLRERERQSISRGGAEREGDTESEAGSRLRAVSTEPIAGLEPTDREIMTWAEVGHPTDWATQAPQRLFIFETEREREQGRAREGDTESETGSRLWAVSTEPDVGLEPTDREIMTWAEVGRLTNWATQAPHSIKLLKLVCILMCQSLPLAVSGFCMLVRIHLKYKQN